MTSVSQTQIPSNNDVAAGDLVAKTVSATEAKAKLSSLMKWAVKNQDSVIIQSRGKPQVAIICFNDYEELQQLKQQIKRQEALDRLEVLAKEVQARNQDLTTEEADRIADEISRAAIDSLVEKGEVRFTE